MWLLLLTALAAETDPDTETDQARRPWDFRMEVGGEIGQAPFGVVNVGWRNGPLTIEWLTDTLHLKYGPDLDGGRAWVALRAEAGAAGMFLSSWEDGQRTPDRDLFAFYEGVEGGAVGYLPGGLYAGAQAKAYAWHFLPFPTTTRDVPGTRPVLTAEAILGLYHPLVHVWVVGGTDWSLGWQPHVRGELIMDIPGVVRPVVELRAGWGQDKDEITVVRLGGQNPYVVPLAGAAWAEFRVEDYAAGRLGFEGGPELWTVGVVGDLAWFDGRSEAGFALQGSVQGRGRWIEASLGWAPWLARPGSVAMTGWIRLGVDWGQGVGPRDP